MNSERRREEQEYMNEILKAARLRGWDHFHVRDSRGTDPGWPDLVLWRAPNSWVFAELKIGEKRLTKDQEKWIERLQGLQELDRSNIHVCVWRRGVTDIRTVEEALR